MKAIKKHHYSIQIQCNNPCEYVSVLLKLSTTDQQEAEKIAKNKARELWVMLADYKPYRADLVDELNNKRIKLK